MKYLFSEIGLHLLESLSFTRTLYAFDFDGTLAPIVSRPELAKISHETETLLDELASCVSIVVISGRSIGDLHKCIKLDERYLIGNHGLEKTGMKKETAEVAKECCRKWLIQLAQYWGSLKDSTGIFIEDKIYSLAIHYRGARNKKNARLELFSMIGQLETLPRVILGKCVINIIPSGGPHKGVALLEAMVESDCKNSFYIGDDDTDEDVFSLPNSQIMTVRVGQKKQSQAQFFLKRQSEINRLLRFMIKMNK